ncbi:MAG: DNA translocase FtsK 4TM domain-containing protein [Gammaproteobacteria bacterium]
MSVKTLAQARRKTSNTLGLAILQHVKQGLRESSFVVLIGVALYLVTALISFNGADPAWTRSGGQSSVSNLGGIVGAWFADISLFFFGYVAYLLPLAVVYCGWSLFRANAIRKLDGEVIFFRALGFVVALGALCGLGALILGRVPGSGSGGGIIGDAIGHNLVRAFSVYGSSLFLMVLFFAGFTLGTGLSWGALLDHVGRALFVAATGSVRAVAILRRWIEPALERMEYSRASSGALTSHDKLDPAQGLAGDPTPVVADDGVSEPAPKSKSSTKKSARREPVLNAMPSATLLPEAARGSSDHLGTEPAREPPLPMTPSVLLELDDADDPIETLLVGSSSAAMESSVLGKEQAPRFALLKGSAAAQAAGVYRLPSLDLLDPAPVEETSHSAEMREALARQVEALLRDFGVEVKAVGVEPGPVITRIELSPAPGIKVSQITGLAKDLARGLSVVSVRVVEVIPGKSYVGLEIPNQHRKIVYLSEILGSLVYRNLAAPLSLALGQDIGGRPVVANLAKMPHLLVAGTTGSGKSVGINAMLLSILYKATPQEVRLIMVDPKMLELSVYDDIPHLLTPVVTDMKDAANALRWCVGEMERRYRLMAALKVRNIAGFNHQVSAAIEAGKPVPDPLFDARANPGAVPPMLESLPYIVVVIDELADMMMVVGKKVEELIARLAQKARAAGIHLIIATQRPSVDVITGLIKANIPTRIAFQVSSKVDSRTILDQMGAESLLGHGDMLFQPPGTGLPQRVHGAFVADEEVHRVVEYLKRFGKPDYSTAILEEPSESGAGFGPDAAVAGDAESDPLYDQAVRIVIESRRASISAIQRRLKIGYNRAARMVEQMESAGLVGSLQANGNREVLVPPPADV